MHDLYSLLLSYNPLYALQNQYKKDFLAFLSQENLYGHITVSAMICDINFKNILLCFHNRYREWSPVGGHACKQETLMSALHREIYEEIGISEKNCHIDAKFPLLSIDKSEYQCRTAKIMHYDICLLVHLNQENLVLKPNHEIQELRFFNIAKREFLSVPLPSYTKQYCLALEKYILKH